MAWTDERIAQLKAGWEGGMTASQIAEALGEGVSRNAVIGKAHRLGLESRPSPVKGGEEIAAAPAPKPIAPITAAPAPVALPRPAPAKKPVRTGKAIQNRVDQKNSFSVQASAFDTNQYNLFEDFLVIDLKLL